MCEDVNLMHNNRRHQTHVPRRFSIAVSDDGAAALADGWHVPHQRPALAQAPIRY
jgi:hypothetical protein